MDGETEMHRFEEGQRYYLMSYPDGFDVRYEFTIVKRTPKTVVVRDEGGCEFRCKISVLQDGDSEGVYLRYYGHALFAYNVLTDEIASTPKRVCIWGNAQ